MASAKPLEYKIVGRHVRLRSGSDGTTFPWPFTGETHCDAAWRARYAPGTLTAADVMELAGIADAYSTLISHPARGVAEQIFDLRRVFKETHR